MDRLALIPCCWLLKKTLVITTDLANTESASKNRIILIKLQQINNCNRELSLNIGKNLLDKKYKFYYYMNMLLAKNVNQMH